jgi:hypothetical protein
MSMILLQPANTITHFNVEIKRRTISLAEFSVTSALPGFPTRELNENPALQEL